MMKEPLSVPFHLALGVLLVASSVCAFEHFVEGVGGASNEQGYSLVQLENGTYVALGVTNCYGSACDVFVVSFDTAGALLWSKNISSNGFDLGKTILTDDGDLLVFGYSNGFGLGGYDLFLSKLDSSGTPLWTQAYGGGGHERPGKMIATMDGGVATIGHTKSYQGFYEMLLSKFDSTGAHQWSKRVGGVYPDYGYSLCQASDGGYLVTGSTENFGATALDALVTKFDSLGTLLWSRMYGGDEDDIPYSVCETADAGFVIAGYESSVGQGVSDVLVSKFDASGTHLWSETYGTTSDEYAYAVVPLDDGGVALTGRYVDEELNRDRVFVSRIDASGALLWTRAIGLNLADYGYDLIQTQDGGFALTGYSQNVSSGSDDLVLAKLDSDGYTCMGEYITPTIEPWDHTVQEVTPTVTDVTPNFATPTPTVTSPDVVLTMGCPICGDCTGDMEVTPADGYTVLNYLGSGPFPTYCWSANAAGGDGITPADGYQILNYLGTGPDLQCAPCEF
jgi:hypothetical protein